MKLDVGGEFLSPFRVSFPARSESRHLRAFTFKFTCTGNPCLTKPFQDTCVTMSVAFEKTRSGSCLLPIRIIPYPLA